MAYDDEFGYHEVIDRLNCVVTMTEKLLMDHQLVEEKYQKEVDKILQDIVNLYSKVSADSLEKFDK
jgi:hypothetical protein